jgi:glycosyltransferase involved in cell wall biosynthesis
MHKTILIITDNLPGQINGVVTTYKNIETCAVRDGYHIVYITPGEFCYFDCPGYNEVKIAIPWSMGKKIEALCPDYIHIATEGPVGLWARAYLSKRGYRYTSAYHTKFPEGLNKLFGIPEKYTWPVMRWFHKNSSRILTTTDSMVNQLHLNGFGDNVVSWTRGVDRKIFNSDSRIYQDVDVNVKSPVLLCVSRISKEKNLEDFFNLEYPGATKIMVGDGPMRLEYESRYPDVKFVGYNTVS